MKNRYFGELMLEWIDPEEYHDLDSKWMYLCTLHEWIDGTEVEYTQMYDIVVHNETHEIRYTEIDLI